MTTYKEAVRTHIQNLLDDRYKQFEVARLLDFPNPNFVSMLLNPNQPQTLLPAAKLPLLQKACGFSDEEAVRLFKLCCEAGPDGRKTMQLNHETFGWLQRIFVEAARCKAACAPVAAVPEFCHV